MTPLQRASLVAVGFMLTVFACFMTMVVVFFATEWHKQLATRVRVDVEVGHELSDRAFVIESA
jgi:hypothetical protein